jgi:hypothetical protein
MKTRALMAAAVLLGAGCEVIAGLGDEEPYSLDGGPGGAGGAASSGGTTSATGSTTSIGGAGGVGGADGDSGATGSSSAAISSSASSSTGGTGQGGGCNGGAPCNAPKSCCPSGCTNLEMNDNDCGACGKVCTKSYCQDSQCVSLP